MAEQEAVFPDDSGKYGYLEGIWMGEMAASLGKSFKISDFHEAVLNVGSCNFAILRQEIEKETEILSKVP